MISIKSVSLDTAGWTLHEDTPQSKAWIKPEFREMLSLHYFALPPDILFSLSNLDSLREHTISSLQPPSGELVDLYTGTINGLKAIPHMLNVPMREDGRGRIYVASFTFPFEAFSFVIKVQCPEIGITGRRESAIVAKLMREGKIDLSKLPTGDGAPVSLPSNTASLISATTDDEAYDKEFPNHPLTRARSHLRHVRRTLIFEEAVHKAPPFR